MTAEGPEARTPEARTPEARPAGAEVAGPGSAEDEPRGPEARILGRAEAVRRFGRPRRDRLVFTNGCFDLLHPGHLACLEAAAGLGDRLVVGVNEDASVRRLKGPGRPLLPARERARVVAALRVVDAVVLFPEDTPLALIRTLRPDVLVKGGDYAPEEVVGREVVEADGGRVVRVPLRKGWSTTELLARIRRTDGDEDRDGNPGGGGGDDRNPGHEGGRGEDRDRGEGEDRDRGRDEG